ncbi:hypothetical protein TNCV_1019851 [Trichonephila clavipes]|nr:hypothetical protein TNCV_1019851 [Trichonephila clavipes]
MTGRPMSSINPPLPWCCRQVLNLPGRTNLIIVWPRLPLPNLSSLTRERVAGWGVDENDERKRWELKAPVCLPISRLDGNLREYETKLSWSRTRVRRWQVLSSRPAVSEDLMCRWTDTS